MHPAHSKGYNKKEQIGGKINNKEDKQLFLKRWYITETELKKKITYKHYKIFFLFSAPYFDETDVCLSLEIKQTNKKASSARLSCENHTDNFYLPRLFFHWSNPHSYNITWESRQHKMKKKNSTILYFTIALINYITMSCNFPPSHLLSLARCGPTSMPSCTLCFLCSLTWNLYDP